MAVSPTPSLSAADLAAIDAQLAATDQLLERNYPGDDGTRQPVHTVYVPADRFTPSFAADWGAEALNTAEAHGGLVKLGTLLGQDAATAEISRSQVWQQIRNKSVLADTGNTVTRELVEKILGEETERLRTEFGDEAFRRYYQPASKLIAEICLSEDYTDFLTTPAYELVG